MLIVVTSNTTSSKESYETQRIVCKHLVFTDLLHVQQSFWVLSKLIQAAYLNVLKVEYLKVDKPLIIPTHDAHAHARNDAHKRQQQAWQCVHRRGTLLYKIGEKNFGVSNLE